MTTENKTTLSIGTITYPCFIHPIPNAPLSEYPKDKLKDEKWANYASVKGYDIGDVFLISDVIPEAIKEDDDPKKVGYSKRLRYFIHDPLPNPEMRPIQISVVKDEADLINAVRQYATIGVDAVQVIAKGYCGSETGITAVSLKQTHKAKYVGDGIFNMQGVGLKLDKKAEVGDVVEVNTYGEVGGVDVIV